MSSGTADVRVSVVMIVRNGERFLGAAIESVRSQLSADDEIIVVDGASTDGSVRLAEQHNVRVLQQHGYGIGDARNRGVALTTGCYVAFLDHDDLWLPGKLEHQVGALEAAPEAHYSITRLQRVAVGGAAVAGVYKDRLTHGPVRGLTPSTLVVRRSAAALFGEWDNELGVGADADWFARAQDLQLGLIDLPQVYVLKQLHDRNASIDTAQTRREILNVAVRSVRRKRFL